MMRLPALPLALAAAMALGSGSAPAAEGGSAAPAPAPEVSTQASPGIAGPDTAIPGSASPAPPGPAPAADPKATATLGSIREIVLDLSDRRISLIENGRVMGSWPVAIGDPGTPTPTGRFAVRNKVLNPQYQSTKSGKVNPTTGPNSPLGDRWLGFLESGPNQYGIHGTPGAWAWTVTSQAAVTNGCVRMLADHVRSLFEQVDVGTPVVVRP
jgi:lipoprotein-anchoring transpeptidase ErfK/SrfK